MIVTFYKNFSKRINSTLRPTGGTDLTCYMKDDCSVLSPVFLIDGIDLGYNYCKFNDRYYFITDITLSNNNIYEISCSVDVLATYKTSIGAYTAFVERAASSYDTLVTDNLVTSSNNITAMNTTTVNMPTASGDIFMVPLFGRDGVLQYIFTSLRDASVFFNTGDTMTIDGDSLTASDWLYAIKNAGWVFAGSDVTSYMGDMVYMPYLPPTSGAQYIGTNDIAFGFTKFSYNNPAGVYKFNVLNPNINYYKFTGILTDPGNIYSDFRAYDNRFSQYKIYLPGCGVYDINAGDAGKKDLKVDVTMDWLTTAVTYRIYHDSGSNVAQFEGKFGCGVPAMGAKLDVFGILQDTATGVGAVMKEDAMGAVKSVVSAAQKSFEPQVNARSSGAGNGATLKNFPHILYTCKNFESKDLPTTVAGRPLYQNVNISTLSGFVRCGAASVAISGFDSEREQVNNYLNSGFYYE